MLPCFDCNQSLRSGRCYGSIWCRGVFLRVGMSAAPPFRTMSAPSPAAPPGVPARITFFVTPPTVADAVVESSAIAENSPARDGRLPALLPGSSTRVIRRSRAQEQRAIYNALENKQKNGDGWIRVRFPPPVSPPGTVSPPRRVREKRVISKVLTEWAEYRLRRLRAIWHLSSAVFSAGWELRQFSTQLWF